MKNAEWMLQQGMEFSKLSWAYINLRNIVYYDKGGYLKKIYSEKSICPENITLNWLDMEHKEPILDDVERRYLSAVIKPFRNDVKKIRKAHVNYTDYERIESYGKCYFYLPAFEAGTMYKDMEPDRWYTLEELGL